ncbi:SRPBCC domain-containing protein [Mucilaginibacter sabulilitoris]|uniref:SRPBCC domain-containing protein n=1 Tax=Mucilaginibacter sabulilitoris TaxID=1173583 RepID=A0ABZ0TYX8_9SPHI|nr:SRPBCC domain-containing protein [Mucilaginibacter sabulilitoris]WPU96725.1 SRPBCC domain-containing protein [Mucilaginibacter sabulilitoris]
MLKPVQISHYFPVSATQVFDAWLNPEVIKLWMFKSPTNRIVSVKIERWVGGSFSVLELSGDEEIDHYGEYKEITGLRHLGFSLEVPKHFPGVTHVDIHFEPEADGCKLTLTQTGVPAKITEGPWTEMLNNLEALLMQKSQ